MVEFALITDLTRTQYNPYYIWLLRQIATVLLFFSEKPGHKLILRKLAIIWTLIIILMCLAPASEVPNVHIPFIDKWVHFIIFGVFAFLWLSSVYGFRKVYLLTAIVITIVFGWLVEVLQGQLTFLGRSQDNMDTLADGVGGILGTIIFYIGYTIAHKKAIKN